MPPTDHGPEQPEPAQVVAPRVELWVVRLDLNILRQQRTFLPDGQVRVQDLGASNNQQLGEGATPGEAYRMALERLKPIIRAYKLEAGPIPLEPVPPARPSDF